MRKAWARLALALALAAAFFGASAAAAQEGAAPASESPLPVREAAMPAHGPDDENALSRFGIVAVGSFPIMLLYSDFSFDIGMFVAKGFDSYYAPWPFKSEYSYQSSDAEKALRIGVAIGASVAVGAIDYLIRQSKAKKARLKREALQEYAIEGPREGEAREAPPQAELKPKPKPKPESEPGP